MATIKEKLNKRYNLSQKQIDKFRENGFVKLPYVFTADLLDHYDAYITRKVVELNNRLQPMEERSTYHKAFIQIANLWQKEENVKEFVFGQRLAQIATRLLGTDGVRLYHDQALFKEPGGGLTPWHADQYYWPLATEKCVTAWVPLQETPVEMGPLAFAAKSQHFSEGRDMAISDESEQKLKAALRESDYEHVEESFDPGEVSFHYGWTFHHAGPNNTDKIRKAMTVIYMDKDMRLQEPVNENQKEDWKVWCPGARVGEIIDTPLNPLIYSE